MHVPVICCYILDINECANDSGGCSHICTNTEGSFECSCRDGYILDTDRRHCSGMHSNTILYYNFSPDINECDESNGGCSHYCINTEGSFECFCRDGYILVSDGKNCLGAKSDFHITIP